MSYGLQFHWILVVSWHFHKIYACGRFLCSVFDLYSHGIDKTVHAHSISKICSTYRAHPERMNWGGKKNWTKQTNQVYTYLSIAFKPNKQQRFYTLQLYSSTHRYMAKRWENVETNEKHNRNKNKCQTKQRIVMFMLLIEY